MSSAELEALKRKYNLENENELRLLQERELNALNISQNNQAIDSTEADLQPDNVKPPNAPAVNRSLKPKSLGNSYNLRTLIVPSDLHRKFLDLAQANTLRNIETCGILAGRLVSFKKN